MASPKAQKTVSNNRRMSDDLKLGNEESKSGPSEFLQLRISQAVLQRVETHSKQGHAQGANVTVPFYCGLMISDWLRPKRIVLMILLE